MSDRFRILAPPGAAERMAKTVTRRRFLGLSAVSLGGLAVGGSTLLTACSDDGGGGTPGQNQKRDGRKGGTNRGARASRAGVQQFNASGWPQQAHANNGQRATRAHRPGHRPPATRRWPAGGKQQCAEHQQPPRALRSDVHRDFLFLPPTAYCLLP